MESKMDIKIEVKELLNDSVEKLLFWALEEKRSNIVEHATGVFLKGSEQGKDLYGFNDWFVHDYRTEAGKSLADLYKMDQSPSNEEIDALESISKSVFSAFERMPIKDKMVVKDLFTKSDYQLDEILDASSLMLARIYRFDGMNVIVEQPEFMPDEYKTLLVKGMLEKYNEYCSLFAPSSDG